MVANPNMRRALVLLVSAALFVCGALLVWMTRHESTGSSGLDTHAIIQALQQTTLHAPPSPPSPPAPPAPPAPSAPTSDTPAHAGTDAGTDTRLDATGKVVTGESDLAAWADETAAYDKVYPDPSTAGPKADASRRLTRPLPPGVPPPPDAFPDAFYELGRPAFISRPLPQCGIGVFNHVHKTGGTTIRRVLVDQAQWGHFEYFSVSVMGWPWLMRELVGLANETHVADPAAAPRISRRHPRILIEVHGDEPYDWPYKMRELKTVAALLGPDCEVVTFAYLREPVSHYLSYFNYFVPRTQFTLCTWDPPLALQSKILLGIASPPEKDRIWKEDPARDDAIAKAARAVLDEYSVVGVLDLFDESLLAIADKLGLQHPEYPGRMNVARTSAVPAADQVFEFNSPEWRASKINHIKKLQQSSWDRAVVVRGYEPEPCVHTKARKSPRDQDAWAEQILDDIIKYAAVDFEIYESARARMVDHIRDGGPEFANRVHGLRASLVGKQNARQNHIMTMLPAHISETCVQCGYDGRVQDRGCWGRFSELAVGELTALRCERVWDPPFGLFNAGTGSETERDLLMYPQTPLCFATCWTVHDEPRLGGHRALTAESLAAIGMKPGDRVCSRPCSSQPDWAPTKEDSMAWRVRWSTMVDALAPLADEHKALADISPVAHALPMSEQIDRLRSSLVTRQKAARDMIANEAQKAPAKTPLTAPLPKPWQLLRADPAGQLRAPSNSCAVGLYFRVPGSHDEVLRDTMREWSLYGELEYVTTLGMEWTNVVHELVGNFEFDPESDSFVPPGGSRAAIRHPRVLVEVSFAPAHEWYSDYTHVEALRQMLSRQGCAFFAFTALRNPFQYLLGARNRLDKPGGTFDDAVGWLEDPQTGLVLGHGSMAMLHASNTRRELKTRVGANFLLNMVIPVLDMVGVVGMPGETLAVVATKLGIPAPVPHLGPTAHAAMDTDRALFEAWRPVSHAIAEQICHVTNTNDMSISVTRGGMINREIVPFVRLIVDNVASDWYQTMTELVTRTLGLDDVAMAKKVTHHMLEASLFDLILYARATQNLTMYLAADAGIRDTADAWFESVADAAVADDPLAAVPPASDDPLCVHCEEELSLEMRGCWHSPDHAAILRSEQSAPHLRDVSQRSACVRVWHPRFIPQLAARLVADANINTHQKVTLPGIGLVCWSTCYAADEDAAVKGWCTRPCDAEPEQFLNEDLFTFKHRWNGIVDRLAPIE